MTDQAWAICPVMGAPELTEAAIGDLLAQSIPIKILIINQGVESSFRQRLEQISEEYPDRVFCWAHNPPLPSLSSSWNRALRFVWSLGGTEALVINNDTRIRPRTYELLRGIHAHTQALFVSAVGVTAEQYEAYDGSDLGWLTGPDADGWGHPNAPGGPDFSCFMISRECHEKYPFDEGFIPAYGEDCSYHRELMLADEGKLIYSINLPYHHVDHGSGTLKSLPGDQRAALERRIGQSREYYRRKWGPGGINGETFTRPFDPSSARPHVTNPELQALVRGGGSVRAIVDGVDDTAILNSPAPC